MQNHNRLRNIRNIKWLNPWISIGWMPLLWAVLCVMFFWDVLQVPGSHIVGGNDLNNMFRIWLDYARSRISEGQLPLWNPYLFSGHAFISDPQPALFYPPTWLSLIFAPTRGLSWSLVFHIWWAAVGCTLWLRSITDQSGRQLTWAGALGGAAVFAFSGYTFARIQAGHLGVIATGTWLPWTLWAVNSLAKRLSWRTVVGGALSITLAFLAGHTATFIYLALMVSIYALMTTWNLQRTKRRKFLFMAVVMGSLGMVLASIQLLPMLQIIGSSTRVSNADYAFASRFSWPVGYLVTLLVPNFFGEPVRTGYWGDGIYDEMIFYVGLLPMLMIAVAGRIRHDKSLRYQSIFWLAVAGIALLTAFGNNGIVHRLLFRFLPFFSNMRAPARAGFLFTCSAAALTAFSIHTLSLAVVDERRFLLQSLTRSRILGVLAMTAILVIGAFSIFAWGKESNPEAGRFWHLANEIAVFGLFFSLASSWLYHWKSPTPARWLPVLALILILIDLWTLGNRLVAVVPAPLSKYWERVAQALGPESGRVLPWGLSIFEQNGALSYKIKSVFGYNPLEDDTYNRFITFYPDPRARIYDLLNVTHISTAVPLNLDEQDTLSLVSDEGGLYIYKRSTALPRAWIPATLQSTSKDTILAKLNDRDFDPLHTALVEPGVSCQYGNAGKITFSELTAPEVMLVRIEGDGGIVVFSERYTPGWQATLDGVAIPLLKAYGILQAVCVPPGVHELQLRFQPLSFTAGAVVSMVAFIIIGYLYFIADRKHSDHRR